MSLFIVGLGPGDPGFLTREAISRLETAREVLTLNDRHPALTSIAAGKIRALDAAADEEALESLATEVLEPAQGAEDTVYAAPGHPLLDDRLAAVLLRRAGERGVPVQVVSGVSYAGAAIATLRLPLPEGELQVFHSPPPDPDARRPALIAPVPDQRAAAAVRSALLERYPDDTEVSVIRAPGSVTATVQKVRLAALDTAATFDATTCLFVPPLPLEADVRSFDGLEAIVARLRHPDLGCPWDRKQTHESLKSGFLQEAYEVVAALDEGNPTLLQEELGDILLHVLMQSQIAAEADEFTIRDVVLGLGAKLVRRHPHVFGNESVADADEVVANWDAIKRAERGADQPTLASVTPNQPALAYAQELVRRAARTGFEWPTTEQAIDKVVEEIRELAEAASKEQRSEEFGDALLALVNVARRSDVDAEEALRLASRKFHRRFTALESLAREKGTPLDLSESDLLGLWEEVKRTGG
jgi:tetrapyrrole methylase family protein/MazG family protein